MRSKYTHKITKTVRRWFWRYLPSEIAATITALAAAWVTYQLTDSLLAAAFAGSLGENLGYYGVATIREVRHYYAVHRHHGQKKRLLLTSWHSLRGLMVEFGPAEVVDSLFLRPYLLYVMPSVTNNPVTGWLMGKLLADIVFYTIAGTCYELRRYEKLRTNIRQIMNRFSGD